MSAGIWLERDIADHLLAAYSSKVQTLAMFGDGPDATVYLAGIRDTINTLALSFGINPAAVLPEGTPRIGIMSRKGE